MFGRSQPELIEGLRWLQWRLCGYRNDLHEKEPPQVPTRCDCKFGARRGGGSEETGCPEAAFAMELVKAMTSKEFDRLTDRVRRGIRPRQAKKDVAAKDTEIRVHCPTCRHPNTSLERWFGAFLCSLQERDPARSGQYHKVPSHKMSEERLAVHPDSLAQMREKGGEWAAFENQDLSSGGLGHLKFLKIGELCTYQSPPERFPDTKTEINWRYVYVGMVDLETGEVKEEKHGKRKRIA